MINKKVFKAVLANSKNVDKIINEVLKHINTKSDYNDARGNHLLEMLVDDSAIIEEKDVDIDYLYKHLDLIGYTSDNIIVKNIKVDFVDNIVGIVHLKFEYITKAEQEVKNPVYAKADTMVSYLDYPKVIKQ